MTGGDCFEAALEVALTIVLGNVMLEGNQLHDPVVCHGLPIGQGPANRGRRYWHAWVEVVTPAGPMVLDWSNGNPTVGGAMRRTTFYRVGRIQPDQVLRYTVDEVAEQLAEHGHGGPWVNDPVDVEVAR